MRDTFFDNVAPVIGRTAMTLVPAYGRDYNSRTAVLEAWHNNMDFIIQSVGHPYDGKPINKAQVTNEIIMIRYRNKRLITEV